MFLGLHPRLSNHGPLALKPADGQFAAPFVFSVLLRGKILRSAILRCQPGLGTTRKIGFRHFKCFLPKTQPQLLPSRGFQPADAKAQQAQRTIHQLLAAEQPAS